MSQFIQHIFPTPFFVGTSPSVEAREKICELAYKFKEEASDAGLVSEGWDANARSSSKADYDEYGVTSFYSKNLLRDPEWKEVADFIQDFSASMISTVYGGGDSILLNMWTTIYPQGAFVPQHIHDNCLLSGVFYAKARPGCGNLVFEDPAHVAKNMSSRGANVFPTLPSRYTQEIQEGMMVLFPAWLPHQTRANRSGEDRIIVSFNIGFQKNALEELVGKELE
jgi:uncharacterized protein (TIGR02466 family)